MILLHRKTLTDAWHDSCATMFFAREGDKVNLQKGSSMTISYRNVLVADSMAFEMDTWLNLHLTKARFPVLQRTYLNIDEFEAFLVRCRNVAKERGAVTKLHANPHKPRGANRTKKTGNYAHGGCIHGWDFRVDKATKKPELAMHSRVSYLSYMGGLDLALCYVIAKEVGAELGYEVEDFSFVWYCSAFQYAHMQGVAYTYNRPDFMEAIKRPKAFPDEQYPTVKLMRKTIRDFAQKRKDGFTPEQEKFAQLMRYRRRWEARVAGDTNGGKWVSIPVDTLTLDSLKATRVTVTEDNEVEEYNPHE